MSSESGRGAHGDKGKRGASRRRKNEVSLADRLEPQPGAQSTVLPGKGTGKGKGNVPPVAPQTRKQLRQQRAEQKQKAQQRWILTAVAVIAVVVVGVLLAIWLAGRGDDTVVGTDTGRTERTLAMTLAAEGEGATSGALMVSDSDDASAASVLIPSRLFVVGATPEGLPFSDTVLLGDDQAPGTALADTLDVIVDDSWQVSDDMLAQLVDAADGVLVDVDVDVLDGRDIVIAAGDGQLLNGEQAVAYATYSVKDEVEEARLARFGQVLDQVMQRLPDDRAELVTLFDELNATERATLNVDELADFALAYGDAGRSGDAASQTLPTIPLETGARNPGVVVDTEGLERLRNGLLADSLPPDAGGDQIAVYVQNGVGTPDLEQEAADLLRDEGYEFLNGGNANEFERDETLVLIPDASTASISLGSDVAATLGVPDTAVQINDQGSSVADVIVILGKDFKP